MTVRTPALFALLVALAWPGDAAARKRPKDPAPEGEAKAARKDKSKNGAKADEDAPPMTSYQIELEIQSREQTITVDRKRGIALLEEFIAKHANSRAMPEALYRLAALYWERSQNQFLASMEAWAKQVDACKDDPESCPQGPPAEPQLDLTASQAIYVKLIDKWPTFRKIDTVRYLYGFSLRDQGKADEAQAQFRAIIEKHPSSQFVPDSWLAIGDHRFYGSNDWRGALEAYEHVLDHPQSDSYPMALFKTAWCHWKLGESQLAIRRFKEVLDQGSSPETDEAGRKRLQDLREEALEYLVQVISEDEKNTPKDIYDFLASIDGEKYGRKVLIRLGEAYEAQTRYDKSVPTYRFLIELDPKHADCAQFQMHVVTGVRGDGKTALALDELGKLHAQYGPGTAWAKTHPQEAKVAREQSRVMLYDLARSVHESAQAAEKDTKVPDKERYALAARAYEDYIVRHPASPQAVEVSYLSGDIYRIKLKLNERAGDAYLRVGESAPVGPMHRDALLAAIDAYEKALAEGPPPEEPKTPVAEPVATPPTNGTAPASTATAAAATGATPEDSTTTPEAGVAQAQPYNRVERKFIHAIDLFSALFPQDDENGAILYKLGEFFYGRGDYDGAVQRYGKVVVDHPESANAGASGDRILESLQKAADYDNIELWAGKLKGAPAFAAKDEQARLDRIIVDSLLKQGDTLADRGYYERAASYYLRVPKEYPKHEKAALALNNAGAALERAKNGSAATEVYERLAKDYPGTTQAADATLVMARVYEKMGDYERAAQRYDQLVERYPKHPERADALYNAGVLYQGLAKSDKAAARYATYSKQYGDRKDATEVALRVGEVQAKAGQHKAAAATLQKFVQRHDSGPEGIEANLLLGKSQLASGRLKDADKSLARAVKLARESTGESRIHGAEARYLQGEIVYREFEQAKLDPKPSKLGASLERKAKLLGGAKDIYLDVLSFGAPEWSTAALHRIGESYEKFARSLRDYPMPKGLNAQQQDEYREQLDTFALMFEEEAIGAYRSGYAKAVELKIFNVHTRKIRDALGRLSRTEFPPIVEVGTDLAVAEGSGGGGRPVRSLRR